MRLKSTEPASRTVIITGASSGIGRATALYFAYQGWNVVATSRSGKRLEEFREYANISCQKLDVTNQESIRSVIEKTAKKYASINVVVNNAGYGTLGAFEASTPSQVRAQFDVNVFGLMDVVREVVPVFRKQKHGVIVNISSMGGRITFPLYGVYHATKWAVEGFSESLAYELRPFGITVKLIEPGTIKTEFIGRSEVRFSKRGLKEYSDYEKMVVSNFHKSYRDATNPIVVAKKIYQASTDGKNKLRYPVAKPALSLILLKKLLPESVFFWFVRSQLK
jgi:short-subunit dehydrogenase